MGGCSILLCLKESLWPAHTWQKQIIQKTPQFPLQDDFRNDIDRNTLRYPTRGRGGIGRHARLRI